MGVGKDTDPRLLLLLFDVDEGLQAVPPAQIVDVGDGYDLDGLKLWRRRKTGEGGRDIMVGRTGSDVVVASLPLRVARRRTGEIARKPA